MLIKSSRGESLWAALALHTLLVIRFPAILNIEILEFLHHCPHHHRQPVWSHDRLRRVDGDLAAGALGSRWGSWPTHPDFFSLFWKVTEYIYLSLQWDLIILNFIWLSEIVTPNLVQGSTGAPQWLVDSLCVIHFCIVLFWAILFCDAILRVILSWLEK